MRRSKLWHLAAILLCIGCLTSCLRVAQAPVVVIQAPISGTTHLFGATITFAGTATDAQDGTLTGASLVWTSSEDGEIGTGTTFTKDDLALGTHTITLTATNSLALSASASVAITVSNNASPTVTINAPSGGATFAHGAPITLDGEATDAEDGALTGGSLVWTSSLDGTIGSGETLIKTALAEGTHVITLTATDSEGATSTDTVTIYVQTALTDSCYVYSIPDAGGVIALEIPQAGQELLYTLTVSWEGPLVGAYSPGLFWPVVFTQASDGSWLAGPAMAIAGVVVSDGSGTNGDAAAEDILGEAISSSGNFFVLHDDYSGVETDADWWTFELDNSNPAEQFSNVKLYVFPEATIDPQRIEEIIQGLL